MVVLTKKFGYVMIILLYMPVSLFADVDFESLNGSDLGMGIGARAIGLGGAFVSIADDASAIFWNPAGLTDISENQLLLSADLPYHFSAFSLILTPSFWGLEKIKFTLGLSLVNRLTFKGDSGMDTWEGYPSYFLDVSMIDIDSKFIGAIDSRTHDKRISFAFTYPGKEKLSIGINLLAMK